MPQLIVFILRSFAAGAAIGTGLFASFLVTHSSALNPIFLAGEQQLLMASITLYAIASTFGLGSLSTALALIGTDEQ